MRPYTLEDGKLVIDPHEAETVHYIFQRYIQLGSMASLLKDLKSKGYKTPGWVSGTGKHYPAKNFSKSSVYRILNNPIYIGKIQHKAKSKIYDGQHKALLEEKIWNKVKGILESNTAGKIKESGNGEKPYFLKGVLENPNGYSMTPSSQRKNDKLYRYYVSMESIKKGAKACPVKTISAPLIEEIVLDRVKQLVTNVEWVNRILNLEENDLNLPSIRTTLKNFEVMWDEIFPVEQARFVRLMIDRIILHPDRMLIHFRPLGMICVLQELKPDLNLEGGSPHTDETVILEIPISFKKKGARKYIKAPNGKDIIKTRQPKYDHALIKAVVRSHGWQESLEYGLVNSTREIALQEVVRPSYVQKIIKLTDLAPNITTAILNGQQPHSLTLSQINDIPLSWQKQREQYGFNAA